jgi:hypothetical protein
MQSTPYSNSRRWATTSNCSVPTAPRIRSLLWIGLNSWVAPSSASCCRPFCSCFIFSGLRIWARRKCSGAKQGMPVNLRSSPSLKASPSSTVPWLGMPRMSPGQASSVVLRSWAMKVMALFTARVLPVERCRSLMPRSNLPEQTRTKAMRSRCLGSMLAWILKTKPENFGSPGCTWRVSVARGCGGGREVDHGVEQALHAEVVDRRAEEHRRLLAGQVGVAVEGMRGAAHQFDFHAQFFGLVGDQFVEARVVEALDDLGRALVGLRVEEADAVVVEVVHAAKALAHADRPGHRRALDAEHGFDFVEQLDRRPAFAVELVDEGQDRRVAQAADVEQLDGLRFDAVHRVDHHHRRVDGGQGAVGVFGEVLVARRVEQVDHALAVGELHHRAGDRDAALLFQFHPVRGGVAAGLARADLAGDLDRAAEPEQLFGQRGLARVGVGNDGKGAAAGEFRGRAGTRWRGG